MIYQALIGAWPEASESGFVKRMQAYAIKAAREGKQETSWTNPNEDYETALKDYIARPARSLAISPIFRTLSASLRPGPPFSARSTASRN